MTAGAVRKNGSLCGAWGMRVVLLAIIYLCVPGFSGFVSFQEVAGG